jgi:hypothetical protein
MVLALKLAGLVIFIRQRALVGEEPISGLIFLLGGIQRVI